MNCSELHSRLLELAEGDLPLADAAAARAHLDECAACRAEVEELQAGAQALRAAVDVLAPRRRYLTAERLQRLTAAHATHHKPFKIITLHRLVAAAAVAAIIGAAPLLIGDFRQFLKPPQEAPAVAEAPVIEWRGPVILAASGRENPMSLMRSGTPASASLAAPSPNQRVGLAVSDTPGLRVPVENVLYDPDESSHWW
jgi:anti-sigma factor RsiW